MPVTITTTKEERIAKLVKELRDAGLVITHMEVSSDSFLLDRFGDGYGQRSMVGRRRVTASIEVVGPDPEDTYMMLMMWQRGGYGYR